MAAMRRRLRARPLGVAALPLRRRSLRPEMPAGQDDASRARLLSNDAAVPLLLSLLTVGMAIFRVFVVSDGSYEAFLVLLRTLDIRASLASVIYDDADVLVMFTFFLLLMRAAVATGRDTVPGVVKRWWPLPVLAFLLTDVDWFQTAMCLSLTLVFALMVAVLWQRPDGPQRSAAGRRKGQRLEGISTYAVSLALGLAVASVLVVSSARAPFWLPYESVQLSGSKEFRLVYILENTDSQVTLIDVLEERIVQLPAGAVESRQICYRKPEKKWLQYLFPGRDRVFSSRAEANRARCA